jgi:hypothetical protein
MAEAQATNDVLGSGHQHHRRLTRVACSRCERAGRYSLGTLIARHGTDFGIPALLRLLSDDGPKRKSVSAYDLCGVHCPDLAALFVPRLG